MTARTARRRAPAPTRKSWLSLNGSPETSEATERTLTRLAWVLAGLLAVALFIMVLGHKVGDYFAETDFYGAYAEGAKLVQHGKLIPSRYGVIGPGYEVALALFGFVIPDLFLAAKLLALVSTVATLMLWFYLLRRRAGVRVAFVAALILCANGTFFRYGYGALTDTPAIALQAAALYLLLARRGERAILAAGLVAALAFLTRYNAVYLLPAGLVAVLGGGTFAERRGKAALLFTAGFFAPVVPWMLYSLARGSGFSFQLHHNIAFDVYAYSKGIPWDTYQKEMQPQFKNLWDVISRDPGAVASRMLYNVGNHLRQVAVSLLGWPTAVSAGIGLVLGLRDRTLSRLWPLGAAAALLFLTLVPIFYSDRYALALLPYFATLAAIAFASPLGALAVGRTRRVWVKPLLVALPIAAAVIASVTAQARAMKQLPVEVLDCAKTLRSLKAPGDRVLARKWHIAYHAGVQPLAFPFADSLVDLARYARAGRARWLYFSWPEAETRPRFKYLLDTTAVVPGLTPRVVTRPHPAVLYEIGPDFGKNPAWLANDTLVAWHFTRSALMLTNDPKLRFKLGGIAWIMGRLEDARFNLDLAVRGDPRNVDAMVLLGNVYMVSGDPEAARTMYERAAALAPGNVEARLGLGWANVTEGRNQEAAEVWRPVISLTRSPNTLERMRMLYAMLGDHAAEAEATNMLAQLRGAR
jgi:tetratricopeptide (TPR) repeat protein